MNVRYLCPQCKSRDVHEINNLHCLWKCFGCGFEGDGAEFDFDQVYPQVSVGDKVRITTRRVTRTGTVLSADNPKHYDNDPAYNIEILDESGNYWYWKQYWDGGRVEVLSGS